MVQIPDLLLFIYDLYGKIVSKKKIDMSIPVHDTTFHEDDAEKLSDNTQREMGTSDVLN